MKTKMAVRSGEIGIVTSMWAVITVLLVHCCSRVQSQGMCDHVAASNRYHVVGLNSRCYHLAQESPLTWDAAAARCRSSNDGYLASIRDSNVNNLLINRAVNLDANNIANVSFYWIGGRRDSEGADVTWIKDPGTDFTAVLEGEAEGFGDRGCLLLDPGQRGWATDICDAQLELFGYICEYSGVARTSAGVISLTLAVIITTLFLF